MKLDTFCHNLSRDVRLWLSLCCKFHNKWPLFLIENHYLSGAILHSFWIFNGKLKKKVAIKCAIHSAAVSSASASATSSAANFTVNGHSCQPKSPQMHLFWGESVAKTPPFDVKNRHFNVKYAVYSSYCPGGDRRTGPSPQSSESSCAIISDPSK